MILDLLPEYRQFALFWYIFGVLAPSNVFGSQLDVFNSITADYNKNVLPVRNSSGPVVVSVELLYLSLLNMDEKQKTITFHTSVDMIWKDENIGWNASEFGGTSSILIPSNLLWKPDIFVTNGLDVKYMLSDEQRFVSVQNNGTVRSLTLCVITNECHLSIDNFPYDIQTCHITLASWMYPTDQIDLIIGKRRQNVNAAINDGDFMGNEEWTLVSLDKEFHSYIGSDGQQYAMVEYTVKLRRQPIYYICVLLIPTFITTTICLFGLFVPAMNTGERVEKVSLGMATLLSMGTILGIAAGEMPKSTTLPLLGFYVLAELSLCAIGVIVSMVIMIAHQRASTRALIPPRWLIKILLLKMQTNPKTQKTSVTTVCKKKLIRQLSKDKRTDEKTEITKISIFAKRLNQVLDDVEEYIADKKSEDNVLLQWIIIFDRIDMFFLIVFNTTNVISSIILFK